MATYLLYRINNNSGIILVIVLLYVFLLSLIVLAAMNIALMQTNLGKNNQLQHYTFEAAEAGLRQAEYALKENNMPHCLLTLTDNLSAQSFSWWQKQCQGVFPETALYYVIEPLVFKPCVFVKKIGNRLLKYYRLNSYAVAKMGGEPVILQATYAQVSKEVCSKIDKQTYSAGRLSWMQVK